MHFEQFYHDCLSHASYLIGSGGVAAVVDPQRDIGIYLDEARRHELRIGYVIETHLHADFVSGHRELADITGATIYLGARGGAGFRHVPVRDGDVVSFGNCRLEFMETPGHTVESVSVLVTDLERSAEPYAVLTGDTLLPGGVGRPDPSRQHTPQQLAHMLWASLQKLLCLPDGVEVWPAHGSGEFCGRDMGPGLCSTIGTERRANRACRVTGPGEFARLLTADVPERPACSAAIAGINRRGAAPLWAMPPLRPLEPLEVLTFQYGGATVLDTRPQLAFEAAHIPGALHIGPGGQYAAWAGALLGVDAEVILIAGNASGLAESRLRLASVGIERVAGYLGSFGRWAAKGLPLEHVDRICVGELAERLHELQVVDVRRPAEWDEGHIEGALLHPLDRLPETSCLIDRARPVAVHCQSGCCSAIAVSLLRARGFRSVVNVAGGFQAWKAQHLPFVRRSAPPAF